MEGNFYRKRPGLNIREVDQEIIILDKESGDVHQLNPTASYIWDLFDGMTSLEKVVEQVSIDFNIDQVQARDDVNAIVEQLVEINLLLS